MTAEQLNAIAENALNDQYKSIINKLKQCAINGKNSCIINNLPVCLSRKLKQKGFVIIPVLKHRYTFFLKKKKIRCYMIQF